MFCLFFVSALFVCMFVCVPRFRSSLLALPISLTPLLPGRRNARISIHTTTKHKHNIFYAFPYFHSNALIYKWVVFFVQYSLSFTLALYCVDFFLNVDREVKKSGEYVRMTDDFCIFKMLILSFIISIFCIFFWKNKANSYLHTMFHSYNGFILHFMLSISNLW